MLNGFTWNGATLNGSGGAVAASAGPVTPAEPGAGSSTRFTWEGGEFAPRLMSRAWEPSTGTVGGRAISGAGIPVAYLVRTDRMVTLTLRIFEDEWEAAREFLAAGQGHLALTWFPDAEDDEDEGIQVYLESPALGEALSPARLSEYERVLEFAVTLRAVTGSPWRRFYL